MAVNYLKNVMKSVAYAAADVTGDHLSTIKDFAETNKEFTASSYAALKNPKVFVRKQVEALQQSKIYKALDYGVRNTVEDLRTGNFYNRERKERDELALSGLDVNTDDLSEFGIDSDWEKNLDSSSKGSEVSAGEMKIVDSIEGSNAALANATVNAVVTASENEIRNSRVNTAMLYGQNEKLFGGIHRDITVLGSTMQQMYKLQSASLQNIDKNMSDFFTQESKLNAERNAILKEMLELQRSVYKSATDKEKESSGKRSTRIRWSDININGAVDINAYFDVVKKNFSNQLSTILPAGFGEDSNMLATFMASPLEGAMKYVVDGVIPATVKAAADQFNGTLSGVFGNIIGELGNARSKNEGGILGTIAKFFGVSTSVNRSIDTSKYEKGPIPFDGITRKAIIDVIPTHLRRIEAAITGRPEEMFDYKSGRWVKASTIKKQFEDIKKNTVKRATADIRDAMNPGVQAVRKGMDNKSDRDSWDKAVEEFEQFLFDNNGRFNPKASAEKNGIDRFTYSNLYKHYSKIRTIYNDFDRIESVDKKGNKVIRNTRNNIRMGISKSVLDAKDYEEKQYRSYESEVGNLFQMYFGAPEADKHGKWNDDKSKFTAYGALNTTKDDLGNTVFNYLQNINKELTWFRLNGIPGSGGVVAKNSSPVKFESINLKNPTFKSETRRNSSQSDDVIAMNALRNIQSGKAVDLRDFSKDEQAYLLGLSSLLSNNAVGEYKSEIAGYNENAISGFMDKHFLKTNIKTLKDVDEAIKKAEKEGKNTNEVSMDAGEEKFFKKIMNRIGAGETVLGGIVGASSEAFTNLLYAADKAVYEMMYKVEIDDDATKNKYNGFMDAMIGKMTDKFNQFSDWFKKDIIDPFKERLGIDDDFKTRFKDSLKGIGSKLWTSFKDANASVYGPLFDKIMPETNIIDKIKQQANDKKEKEVIAENLRNKYNKKRMDLYKNDTLSFKSARDARTSAIAGGNISDILFAGKSHNFYSDNEHELEDKLLNEGLVTKEELDVIRTHSTNKKGEFDIDIYRSNLTKRYLRYVEKNHAKGTPSGKPFAGLTTLTKGEGLISSSGVGIVPKTGVYNISSPTHIINTEDMHSITGGPKVSVQSALGKEKLAAKNAGYNIAHHDKGTLKITNEGVDISGKEILEEAKKNIPEAAAGGLIGGILSMVLGLAGGPLIGAALGAGGSIIARSGSLKEKLFGKSGEDGKNDDSGLISKTVMDSFHKYFPDMAKFGLAGIIPGLITPLGPIGGLLAGAAFGLLKNNEKFTNKYFGEEGKLSLKTKDKKILEDLMPGAAKGAIGGAIATLLLPTPFGLLGNAALGAGLGMMASTDDFKKFILGEEINGERMGGIVGAFKEAFSPFTDSLKNAGETLKTAFEENVIDPLSRFIKPAIHALPIALGAPFRKLSDMLEKAGKGIGKTIATRIKNTRVGKWAGKAVEGVASGAKWLTSLPGRGIGAIGDKLREYDIAHGDMVDMDQDEAVRWMDARNRGDKVSSFLRTSASIGKEDDDKAITVDSATKIRDLLNRMNDTADSAKKNLRKKNDELNNFLTSYKTVNGKKLSKKQINRILEAANKGNLESISAILQDNALEGSSDGMTKAEFNSIMDGDDGKSGLRKILDEAVGAKTRLENIDKIGETEAADGIRDLLKNTHLSEQDIEKLLTDKRARNDFSKLLSDNLLHLEANPEENKLETENNEAFKSMDKNIENILNLLVAKLEGTDEDVKKAAEKASVDLQKGIDTSNKLFDGRRDAAMAKMGQDAENLTEEGKDTLTTGNHAADAAKFGASGINNAVGGFKSLHKVFKGNNELTQELYSLTTDEAKQAISSLSNTKAKNMSKALNQRDIRNTFINGKYEINPEVVEYLSNKNNFKPLKENCILLSQINETPTGKGIYSNYKSIIEIGNIDLKTAYNLSMKYGIKFTSETGDKVTDVTRKARYGGRQAYLGTKKGAKAVAKVTGKVTGTVISAPFKAGKYVARGIGDAVSYDNVHQDGDYFQDDWTEHLEDNAYGTIASHGIGSLLLGLGGSALKGVFNLGKSAVKGAGSILGKLFKGKDKDSQAAAGGLVPGLFGGAGDGANNALGSVANTDETDKAGDGKDLVHVGNGEMIQVERDSSGNVEPDTADSKTKSIMNRLAIKEKMTQKLQAAQLKASELIKTTFDTSSIKESKGGKIGWLGLLLGGTLLWKSGLLQKLYEGIIKPVWTDHLYPWITNKALPWISDKWNNNIKPWLLDTAIPALGSMLAEVVKAFAEDLPAIIKGAIKGTGNIATAALDALTGDKYNAGGKTKISGNQLSEKYGSDFETKMTDENGNALTAEDIANGNYKEIYNTQGVKGEVDKNGNVVFKDQSKAGVSYANTVINAGAHAFANSLATGKTNRLVSGASKVAGWFTKRKGLLAKATGYSGKALTAPAELSGKAGVATKGFMNNAIDNAADRVINKAINSGASNEALEKVLGNVIDGDGSRISKLANGDIGIIKKVKSGIKTATDGAKTKLKSSTSKIKNLFKEGAEESVEETVAKGIKEGTEKALTETVETLTKEGTEAGVKNITSKVAKAAANSVDDVAKAGAKNKGLLAKLMNTLKTGVKKLFENPKVTAKLTKLAEALGKTAPAKFIVSIKESIEKIFNEALEKAVSKVGAQAAKNIASKALFWVFLITDFLSGCDQAESILGVSETTIVEEVIAGIINALCNLLVIPAIFPGTPWIAQKLFKLFGKDLEERQKQADAEYEKYKEETGSTLSKEEYLKRQKSVSGKVGGWISDAGKATVKGIKAAGKGIVKGAKAVGNWITGNAEGTLSLPISKSKSSPITNLFSAITDNDLIKNIKNDFKFDNITKLMDKVKDGKISIFSKDYWKNNEKDDGTLKGKIQNTYGMLTKVMNFPLLMIKNSLELLTSDIEEIGSGITGVESTSSSTAATKAGNKKTIGSKIKGIFSNITNKIKSFFGSGTGNYQYGKGGYSKQIDPSIANIRFNSSSDSDYQTIGDSGCGPAAAVNVLESIYGRGKSAVASAAKFALRRGHKETNGGTKPGFFTEYFNNNGLNSQTSYNKSVIARNISNGYPTVIMGSNAKGVSSSSPFGKNPHYVTVTGTDGRGNAIVQDPESRYDNQLYPINSLMRNTTLGVSAYGRSKWGRGPYDAQIWWYLKQMGMTDEGVAGMMGNLQAESSLMPNNVEDAVNTQLDITDEQYTADVDSGKIDRTTFLRPLGPESKRGYGLAQWTYIDKNNKGRKANFYDYMKSERKVSIADLGAQLDFLNGELTNSYSGVLDVLKSTNDIKKASDAVLVNFEAPSDQSDKVKNKRKEYSQTIYNTHKGTSGEEITGTIINGTESNTNSGNIFSILSEGLSDILNNSELSKLLSEFTNGISDITTALLGGTSDNTSTGDDNNGSNNGSVSGKAADMVRIATGEIGTAENPLGSNDVKYNDWYYGTKNKQPWCASFVSWVANQAGVPESVIPKHAYTPDGYNALKQYEVESKNALPGDLLYDYKPSKGRIGHTGIIASNDGNGKLTSIEGNSTGDAVSKNTRKTSDTNMHIVRPQYESASGGNGIKPLSKFGQFKDSIYGTGNNARNITEEETDYMNTRIRIKHAKDSLIYTIPEEQRYGKGTTPDYSKLINTIITVLMTIADNTDKLNLIVTILNEKLNLSISPADVSNATTGRETLKAKLANALNGISNNKLNNYADSIGDNSINSIISAMNLIASE